MQQRRTNTLAIVALICGIASWIIAPLLASIAGVVCGHMARKQIRRTGEEGDTMAVIGLVLSYLNLVLSCLGALIFALSALGVMSCGVLSCAALGAGPAGSRDEEVTGMADEAASRMQLQGSLQGIKMSCALGGDIDQHFHPEVVSEMKEPACKLTDATVDELSAPNATLEGVAGTEDASKAEDLGVDPRHCQRLTAGAAKVVGCTLSDGTFKLIHVEDLDSF